MREFSIVKNDQDSPHNVVSRIGTIKNANGKLGLTYENIFSVFMKISLTNPKYAGWLIVISLGFTAATAASATPSFKDDMAQRTLACTACHGPEGRAAPDGYYPRLAGKPAGYLYNQLISFRDGKRHYALMTQLIAPLTDAYLLEMAQHFSRLDVPYPAPQKTNASANALARGQVLVLQGEPAQGIPACVQCHGSAMTGVAPYVPGLLGLPRDYLNAQLGAWKTGKRRAHAPDCMKTVVALLSDEDINAASSYLAAQAPPANTKPAASAPPLAAGQSAINCGSAPKP